MRPPFGADHLNDEGDGNMLNPLKQPVRTVVKYATIIALALLMLAAVAYAQSEYVWGDASATAVSDHGLRGYWRYCITVGWDVSQYVSRPHAMSHVSIILGLEECLADCGGACFMFPDTVGVGDGVDGCNVYYYAELNLKGDPTIPPQSPTLKFEPYSAPCEPDVAGTATLCFYSLIPPEGGNPEPRSVWIKFGLNTEEGLISGMLPSCRGTAAYDASTWGSIKRLFR
jgi:hypothetical protein